MKPDTARGVYTSKRFRQSTARNLAGHKRQGYLQLHGIDHQSVALTEKVQVSQTDKNSALQRRKARMSSPRPSPQAPIEAIHKGEGDSKERKKELQRS